MTKMGKAILVYGAGEAAKLFFENCSLRVKNSIVGFIDDDETICGGQLFGLPIFSFGEIFKAEAYKSMKVDTVILALPSQNLMDKIGHKDGVLVLMDYIYYVDFNLMQVLVNIIY